MTYLKVTKGQKYLTYYYETDYKRGKMVKLIIVTEAKTVTTNIY